jgi:HEAT repeat protein
MSDEQSLVAAYEENPDEAHRLILADWYEDHGDPRGTWLRDRELARWMGNGSVDPIPGLVTALLEGHPPARRLLLRIGTPAIPALMKARDWHRRHQIDALLEKLAPARAGLLGLIARLRSSDPLESQAALQALGDLGEDAAPALPHILAVLQDDSEPVRQAAIAALGRFGAFAGQALKAAWDAIGWNSEEGDLAAARGLIAAAADRAPDPPAVRILLDAFNSSHPDVGEAAVAALQRVGPVLFESVLRAFERMSREHQRRKACRVLRTYPDAVARLLAAAQDVRRSSEGRCCAVAALCDSDGEEGAAPRDGALLAALATLREDGDAEVAAVATARLAAWRERPAAIERVRQGLQSRSAEERAQAVERLPDLLPDLPDAPELLCRALADSSTEVRAGAANVLCRLRWPVGVDPTPVFRQAIVVPEPEGRRAALDELRRSSVGVAALLPELLRLLERDPVAEVRRAVARLFQQFPFRTEESLQALCRALRDTDVEVWNRAVRALIPWGVLPADAVDGLLERVRNDGAGTVDDVLELLLLQPELPADQLIPLLRERLYRYPPEGEHGTFQALQALGYVPVPEEILLLVRALDEQHSSISPSAAGLLARLGAPALPELIRHLARGMPDQTCRTAAEALGEMGPAAAPALDALVRPLVTSENELLRQTALVAISRVAPPSETVRLLTPYVRDRYGPLRAITLGILAALEADAVKALPDLIDRLSWEDEYPASRELAKALAAVARHEPQVVPLLREALAEPDNLTRHNALAALAAIGPRAAEAVPDVQALLAQAPAVEHGYLLKVLDRLQGQREP